MKEGKEVMKKEKVGRKRHRGLKGERPVRNVQ